MLHVRGGFLAKTETRRALETECESKTYRNLWKLQLRGPCLQNLILREPSRSLKGTVIVENSDTFNMLYIDYAILFISDKN